MVVLRRVPKLPQIRGRRRGTIGSPAPVRPRRLVRARVVLMSRSRRGEASLSTPGVVTARSVAQRVERLLVVGAAVIAAAHRALKADGHAVPAVGLRHPDPRCASPTASHHSTRLAHPLGMRAAIATARPASCDPAGGIADARRQLPSARRRRPHRMLVRLAGLPVRCVLESRHRFALLPGYRPATGRSEQCCSTSVGSRYEVEARIPGACLQFEARQYSRSSLRLVGVARPDRVPAGLPPLASRERCPRSRVPCQDV